jgi:exodeoxyribonuclease VII large subunit
MSKQSLVNAESEVLSVSQVTNLVKIHLESKFPKTSVVGEISNCKQQASGHIYFTLKDRYASISCVMFRSYAKNLNFPVENGQQVVVSGSIRVYEPRGSYQINVIRVMPAGLGNLHLEFERRKEEFRKRGYFEPALKKSIPRFPKKIGIITSPTGAVIQDLEQVISRRCSLGLELILLPVKVQGEGAWQSVAQALRLLNEDGSVEVIIVARGGGSLEDLWAFNEPGVVEAVFESKIPVVSAVGHETDFTLTDFVADVRAATPSVAGELCVPDALHLREVLAQNWRTLQIRFSDRVNLQSTRLSKFDKGVLGEKLTNHLERRGQDLDLTIMNLLSVARNLLSRKEMKIPKGAEGDHPLYHSGRWLIEVKGKALMERDPSFFNSSFLTRLEEFSQRLSHLDSNCFKAVSNRVRLQRESLGVLKERLAQSDPRKVLEKGYAMVHKNGVPIMDAQEVDQGDLLKVELRSGILDVLVEGKKDDGSEPGKS